MIDDLQILELLAEMQGEATVGLRSPDPWSVTQAAIAIEAMANKLAELARQIQYR